MTAISQRLQSLVGERREFQFDGAQFVQDHITRTWWLPLWLLLFTFLTIRITISQLQASPLVSAIVLVVWIVTVAWTVFNEVTKDHTPVTRWLKNNLYSSITNIELTLVLVLVILAALRGFFDWAVARASFTTDPEAAAETLAQFETAGANWGAVLDNMRNFLIFRYPDDAIWRIWASLAIVAALTIASLIVFRQEKYRRSRIRRVLTILWVLSLPVIILLLTGFGDSGPLRYVNPQQFWGGLLLTVIIAVFAIAASFPIGVLMALGRRSQIRGIPAWLVWIVSLALMIWGLVTSTAQNAPEANTLMQTILAYWPLIFPIFAYLFNRYYQGNVVALFSTVYIEVWRGVPFITVLFMSIILFPIFLPPGVEILGTWRVLVAAALFSSAYLAENVRGGLQSIPNGQYEAADALGLSTYKKYRLIIMPQALRVVIPSIVGQFIGLWKDTTLVAIVGLIELLGIANLISAQPDWLGIRREPYVFVIIVFFIGSALMVSYSRRLEKQLGVGER